ncbi:MAG: DEAD/DEAH box helicase [Candidatus Heimdallarchaeota archaeon]|nr:DEAD/DEAH box helicase [Candidatus Heimdallarchaeota archaeon]
MVLSIIEFFQQLENSEYDELREWQEIFLENYSEIINNVDILGLKIPTGLGKTLLSLLIAEYERSIKGNAVLIVTWTYALADQLKTHASKFGFKAGVIKGRKYEPISTRDAKLGKIRRKQIIGITSYSGFLTIKEISNIDVVIIDDADLFLEQYNTDYQFKIPLYSFADLKFHINELLKNDIYESNIKNLDNDYKLIYFDQQQDLLSVVNDALQSKDDMSKSTDTIIRDLFWRIHHNGYPQLGNLFLTNGTYLFIQPYIPIGSKNKLLIETEKIILMSATLGDNERLSWELGIPNKELEIIDENYLSEKGVKNRDLRNGTKLILPVNDFEVTIEDTTQLYAHAIVELMKHFDKILIILNKIEEFNLLKLFLNEYFKLNPEKSRRIVQFNEKSDLEHFESLEKGFLISAGQYFGIDLPNNDCKCIVIPNLPFTIDVRDKLDRFILQNEDYLFERIARRFTQAVGRLNRSKDHNSVCFIFDPQYSKEIRLLDTWSNYLPIQILAESEFALREMEKRSDKLRLSDAIEISQKFLKKGFLSYLNDIDSEKKIISTNIKKKKVAYKAGFDDEIEAWNKLYIGNYTIASELFQDARTQIRNSINNNTDSTISSRMAFNLYMAASSEYFAWQKGIEGVDQTSVKNLLALAQRTADSIEWFQKLNQIPLIKENFDTSVKLKTEKSIGDPKDFFHPIFWNHELLEEEIKLEIKKYFSYIDQYLISNDEKYMSNVFNVQFHTMIEDILKKVLVRFEDFLDENFDDSKLCLGDILTEMSKIYLTSKPTKSVWSSESENPGYFRNKFIHRESKISNFDELVEALHRISKGFEYIFRDIVEFEFIYNNTKDSHYTEVNKLSDYKNLRDDEKQDKFLRHRANFRDDEEYVKINWNEKENKITDIILILKERRKICELKFLNNN